jgi:hypothetical protein
MWEIMIWRRDMIICWSTMILLIRIGLLRWGRRTVDIWFPPQPPRLIKINWIQGHKFGRKFKALVWYFPW